MKRYASIAIACSLADLEVTLYESLVAALIEAGLGHD